MNITTAEKNMMMRYAHYALDGDLFSNSADEVFINSWREGKERGILPRVFGDTPILEKEISFSKSTDQIFDEFEAYIDANWNSDEPAMRFYHCFKDHIYNIRTIINNKYKKDEFEWGNCEEYENLARLTNTWDIVENKFNGKTFSLTEEGKKVRIQRGEKMMRAIPKICDFFGWEDAKKDFEEFRIFVSKLTNQKTLKGTLCLSIHPFDYMTMSDNGYDWSSCMSWLEDGCYKRGTLEMMNSPMVFIAYLKGEHPFCPCDGVEWTNKKWRQLFVANEELLASIKGYPYNNEALENEVMTWFKELAFERAGIVYQSHNYDYKKNTTSSIIHLMDRPEDTCVYISFSTYTMYNDFGCNGMVGHRVAFAQDFLDTEVKTGEQYNLYLNYSGTSECLGCGRPSDSVYYSNEGQLICDCCEGRDHQCDCCGCYYSEDDLIYFDGQFLCESCLEDETFVDPITDKRWSTENAETLYISYRSADKEFFPSYYDMSQEKRDEFGGYKTLSTWTSVHRKSLLNENMDWSEFLTIPKPRKVKSKYGDYWYYITLDDITDKGAKLFGFYSKRDAEHFRVEK